MLEVFDKMVALVERLRARGIAIGSLDLGGGLGVAYKPGDKAPSICEFIQAHVQTHRGAWPGDPDRARPLHRRRSRACCSRASSIENPMAISEFIIVDAAMNDLIRPALYQSHHEIIPRAREPARRTITADVVGPVCESGDFLARARRMPNVMPGDLLAVCTAGAYGFVAASNYNARPRPPEVLVEGDRFRVIRTRERYEDLIRGE